MLLNFMQNDDWVYYRMVQNFLTGKFTLDPISAPTFYSQGVLAALFAKLFGISSLPILTLLVSVCSYILFALIINKFYSISKKWAFVFAAFLLFNPWFMYASVGFMTENYFLLFTLINIYLFHNYEQTNKPLPLLLSLVISFLHRQVALVFPLAMSVYYLLQKKFKKSLVSISSFIILYAFYNYIFSRTAEMFEKPLQFQHLYKFDYSFALIYGGILLLTACLAPLLISTISNFELLKNKKKLALGIVLFGILFFVLNTNYKPNSISWGEFPYFENIWERTGLYPRGIQGTKYQFRWNYDLYHYWDLTAKIVVSLFISYAIAFYEKRKLLDFNLIYIVLYFGVMLLTETFYDRYLLVLVPFAVLFLIKNIKINRITKLVTLPFLFFLSFYTYQLTADFIMVNNYVWNKSIELVRTTGLAPTTIQGTNAWKLNYRNMVHDYEYDFTYDSSEVNEEYENRYTLVEVKDIKYPGNIFINPKIYLYKKK